MRTTPQLELTKGRWEVSKKRQAELMTRYNGLKAEWSGYLDRAPLSKDDFLAWREIDREIALLELHLAHQYLALKARARKSRRTRPVEHRPGARPHDSRSTSALLALGAKTGDALGSSNLLLVGNWVLFGYVGRQTARGDLLGKPFASRLNQDCTSGQSDT